MKFRDEMTERVVWRRRRLPITLLALSAMIFTGCFSSVRDPQSAKYWVRQAEIPLDTAQGNKRLAQLRKGEFGTVLRTDWAELKVTGQDLTVHFPERCVQVVSIPRIQEEAVDYRGGWKANTGLWGLLAGVPLAVAGGVHLARAGDAPTDAMVNGNPNITTNYTREEMQGLGTSLAGAGAALTVAATTSILLRYWTWTEQVGEDVWYGLRDRKCGGSNGALQLAASARLGKLQFDGLAGDPTVAASVDPGGRIQLPGGIGPGTKTPAAWVRHVLEGSAFMELDTSIRTRDTPATDQVVWTTQSVIPINGEGISDVRASLARLLAARGVMVNSGGDITLSAGEEGFSLTLQAYAKLANASESIAPVLANALGEGAVDAGGLLRSTNPATPDDLKIVLGEAELPGKVERVMGDKGLVTVSATYPLNDSAWISAVAFRGGDGTGPTLTIPGAEATWTIPQGVLEPVRVALLAELAKRVKAHGPDALTPEESEFDPTARLEDQLPGVVNGRATLCAPTESTDKTSTESAEVKATPHSDVAEACATLNTRWSEKVAAYRTKLTSSMPKIVSAAYKDDVSAAYDPESGIYEDTDPDEAAEGYCSEFIGTYEEVVCGKESTLPSGSACSTVRSCHSKMKSKVKSTISKIRAARLAEEARERREAARARARAKADYKKCMRTVVPCDNRHPFCGDNCNYTDMCPCCTPAPNTCKWMTGYDP